MKDVYILSAARTPIGKFGGGLSTTPATHLGATAIRAAVQRAGIAPERVDEVIMGQVIQAGAGQAPARQAALRAGIPDSVGATTINKVCGSGLKAVMMGAAAIDAGRFHDEIVPVEVAGNNGPTTVDTDENPRPDTSAEALAKLRPAFKTDGGTVTAGNSPGITDGAAALVIASDQALERETT